MAEGAVTPAQGNARYLRPSRAQDIVGAKLLTMLANGQSVVIERRDSLEFVDNVSFLHHVRLTLDFGGLGTTREAWDSDARPAPNLDMPEALRLWSGELVVPLMALNRDALVTTDVRSEGGDLVPTFTRDELNQLLGGGLVIWAEHALGVDALPTDLEEALRRVPEEAIVLEETPDANARFRRAILRILERTHGIGLLREPRFRAALRIVTDAEHLIAKVNTKDGRPDRVLSFVLARTVARPSRGGLRGRLWPVTRAGMEGMLVPLGAVNRSGSYRLEFASPHDTWISRAGLQCPRAQSRPVSTKLGYRLNHAERLAPEDGSQALSVDLRCVRTGVSRTSTWAGVFLSLCCVLGLVRVSFSSGNEFLASQDAGASLLLLFPGIVASFLAVPAAHKYTARLQFPIRVAMWLMCAGGFVLATATALGTKGTASIVVWSSVTALIVTLTAMLWYRARQLKQDRRRI